MKKRIYKKKLKNDAAFAHNGYKKYCEEMKYLYPNSILSLTEWIKTETTRKKKPPVLNQLQIAYFQRRQQIGHPYTCCGETDRREECIRDEHKGGVMKATRQGIACPCGKSKQKNFRFPIKITPTRKLKLKIRLRMRKLRPDLKESDPAYRRYIMWNGLYGI